MFQSDIWRVCNRFVFYERGRAIYLLNVSVSVGHANTFPNIP